MSNKEAFWGTPEEFFKNLSSGQSSKKKDYVFLMGNGFNRFLKDELPSSERPQLLAWEDLVIQVITDNPSLKSALAHERSMFLGNGITNTEKVRLMELELGFASEGDAGKRPVNINELFAKKIHRDYNITKKQWQTLEGKSDAFAGCLLKYALGHHNHILTTNFDSNIEGYAQYVCNIPSKPLYVTCAERAHSGKDNAHPFYAWSKYSAFAKKRAIKPLEANEGTDTAELPPGVWHIHGWAGTAKGANIMMSFQKYCSCISRINDLGDNTRTDEWDGRNTWLNLFLKRPLIIAGLGLPQEEIFLRYLFLLKYKLDRRTGASSLNNSYFLVYENEKTPDGREFLEALGVNIVRFNSYKDIYTHPLWKKAK